MREYININAPETFYSRGYSTIENRWIYGYVVRVYDDYYIADYDCPEVIKFTPEEVLCKLKKVDELSIGTHTHLRDSNYKNIFSGDVLRVEISDEGFVVDPFRAVVVFDEDGCWAKGEDGNNQYVDCDSFANHAIVGNIYEDPELRELFSRYDIWEFLKTAGKGNLE